MTDIDNLINEFEKLQNRIDEFENDMLNLQNNINECRLQIDAILAENE